MRTYVESRTLSLWTVLVIALVLAGGCHARKPQQEDTEAGVRTPDEELQHLQSEGVAPPEFIEYQRLSMELEDTQKEFQESLRPKQERLRKLSQQEVVKEWRRRISEVLVERARVRAKIQDGLQRRNREMHERRQEELGGFAVADTPNARALGFTVLDYPGVDGSTSTQPLGLIIACKMLGSRYRWAGSEAYSGRWYSEGPVIDVTQYLDFVRVPGIDPSSAVDAYYPNLTLVSYRPIAEAADPKLQGEVRRSVMINRMLSVHAGTHEAYENVIKGTSDIGLVAREPSIDEVTLAEDEGVEIEVTPIALDAFVFIKNYENPVAGLSIEQIKAIYSGKATNWSSVGGRDEGINAYQRERNSGSQELMEALVMKGTSFAGIGRGHVGDLILQGMGGPYIALTNDKRGLGYSVYYYEHFMAASPNTELLAVDGVLPSYETIQSGAYPYVTNVYAVVRKGTGDTSRAVEIRDWLLSPEGQAVVRESGYVPLRGTAQG
ncbi:MAG: substrate-binding domain-containing protein [Candidatus Hydrogenedentes bacterium]|nr:substrate-binding domain-containing protein [Candidatus Hydrogenedentota bacterium]